MYRKISAVICALALLILSGCSGGEPIKEVPSFLQGSASSSASSSASASHSSAKPPQSSAAASSASVASSAASTAATSASVPTSSTTSSFVPPEPPPVTEPPGLTMSMEGGELKLHRRALKSTPMGKDGTWTIFVYMCGSDLESKAGLGSKDLEEMVHSTAGTAVKFIVETGGSTKWHNDRVDAGKLQRYEIQKGRMVLMDEQPSASMGESSTLESFLEWGIERYPASKMGLVFWNHGSGSIEGVCSDSLYKDDGLLLTEIDDALRSVDGIMTDAFEFIGFDACLMATIETASVCANYARYMIASEEIEPDLGWDYRKIADHIQRNPRTDGRELGKVIADNYYEMCESLWIGNKETLAVIDLSGIDPLILKFNKYAEKLFNACEDDKTLSDFEKEAKKADNFGGNNVAQGYTNMVDLGSLVNAGKNFAGSTYEVDAAIKNAVVYTRNGSTHADACGLAIYYPLGTRSGSKDITVFGDIAISPYYLALVTKIVNGSDDYEGQSGSLFDIWNDFWNSIWRKAA